MIIRKYLIDDYPTLSEDETGKDALERFGEFKATHIPVVDGGVLKGILMEEDVLFHEPSQPLKEYINKKTALSIIDREYFLKAMDVFVQHDLTVLPVVDDQHKYLGVVEAHQMLSAVSENFATVTPGAILVLAVKEKDYSLAEITHIMETEGHKVIWSSVAPYLASKEKVKIHLKTNTTQLSSVISTYERYGYEVVSVFEEEKYSLDLEERYNSLMSYLNV